MKRILIVVDMQNDFIDAALGTKEAVAIVPAVIEKIKNYKGELVIATRDTHQENYMETSEGKHLPVPHCIEGTYGWEIRSDIAEALDEVGAQVINKPTFGSVALAEKLTVLVQEWDLKEEDLSEEQRNFVNILSLLLEIEKLKIKGIIFYDIAIINLKQKHNLQTSLVWAQEHLTTNYQTIN